MKADKKALNCGISSHDVWFYENGSKNGQEAHADPNCNVHFGNDLHNYVEYSDKHIVKLRLDDDSVGQQLTTRPNKPTY